MIGLDGFGLVWFGLPWFGLIWCFVCLWFGYAGKGVFGTGTEDAAAVSV